MGPRLERYGKRRSQCRRPPRKASRGHLACQRSRARPRPVLATASRSDALRSGSGRDASATRVVRKKRTQRDPREAATARDEAWRTRRDQSLPARRARARASRPPPPLPRPLLSREASRPPPRPLLRLGEGRSHSGSHAPSHSVSPARLSRGGPHPCHAGPRFPAPLPPAPRGVVRERIYKVLRCRPPTDPTRSPVSAAFCSSIGSSQSPHHAPRRRALRGPLRRAARRARATSRLCDRCAAHLRLARGLLVARRRWGAHAAVPGAPRGSAGPSA